MIRFILKWLGEVIAEVVRKAWFLFRQAEMKKRIEDLKNKNKALKETTNEFKKISDDSSNSFLDKYKRHVRERDK